MNDVLDKTRKNHKNNKDSFCRKLNFIMTLLNKTNANMICMQKIRIIQKIHLFLNHRAYYIFMRLVHYNAQPLKHFQHFM